MVATVDISESTGVGETTQDDVANCNYGSIDTYELVVATYPIVAGENSYHKCWRVHWTGAFNQIDNLQCWLEGTPTSQCTYKASLTTESYSDPGYVQPATSSITWWNAPTSDPGNANIAIGASLAGTTDSTGYSDYMHTQLQSGTTAPPGNVTTLTWHWQYDEQ